VDSLGEPAEITRLLRAWGGGDSAALDRLTPLVYEQLRRMARRYMRNERLGHTLQATALVNEAFLRVVDSRSLDWTDREHFFAVCARIMRRILVDAARSRAAIKRGGQLDRAEHSTAINFDQLPDPASELSAQVCALDDALNILAQIDARQAHVIELRFFGGLTVEETAQVLKTSPQTVMRDWRLARAWLARELSRSSK
jgi:RNA polymerase sigma factor (TIGR02999 family)